MGIFLIYNKNYYATLEVYYFILEVYMVIIIIIYLWARMKILGLFFGFFLTYL